MTAQICEGCGIGFQRSDGHPECSECEEASALFNGNALLQPFADLSEMQMWAADIMQRDPDFIIGDNYLRRWWVVPRNEQHNMYLHEILHSDDDRALHDHPWENISWLLEGEYLEHLPDGSVVHRKAGDFVKRPATALHRLEIAEGGRAVSLFITGPKIREWGFACPQGWRHWKDFVAENPGQIGRGCGE
ncbi:cupin domain-containing protein [Sphingorhabdus sp. 109]|uniref:cupin domain-containing protein n=1 Tax=Sphingorhabdus sp. 109 TaxID=2653173 RepID=UPI0012EF8871|nr:hypothetical protein [Sphingorhabdus sp. 109]VWX56697.1 conserved hypothetical protein [Sphingorhabdus sp. 109]